MTAFKQIIIVSPCISENRPPSDKGTGKRKGHNELVVLPFPFWFWNLTEILENDSEMSKMKHEVISEHETGFPFSEKEMWANFNSGA